MSTELPYTGGALVLAHFSIKSQRVTILRFAGLKYLCGFYPSYLLVMIHFNWQLDITIVSWKESQGGTVCTVLASRHVCKGCLKLAGVEDPVHCG